MLLAATVLLLVASQSIASPSVPLPGAGTGPPAFYPNQVYFEVPSVPKYSKGYEKKTKPIFDTCKHYFELTLGGEFCDTGNERESLVLLERVGPS
jgi:hypothetical protein